MKIDKEFFKNKIKLFQNWKEIDVCARCRKAICNCDFGTYRAGYVFKSYSEFLKTSYRRNKNEN